MKVATCSESMIAFSSNMYWSLKKRSALGDVGLCLESPYMGEYTCGLGSVDNPVSGDRGDGPFAVPNQRKESRVRVVENERKYD